MELVITNSYVGLASGILLQTYKDIQNYIDKKPNTKNTNAELAVSEKTYQDATEFLKSEFAEYLLQMIVDWNYLIGRMNKPKETGTRFRENKNVCI